MPKFSESELAKALTGLPGWGVKDGQLSKTYEFSDYARGLVFASACGHLAETRDHHPDLVITWCKVEVRLSTHSEGGITEKDTELAEAFDRLRSGDRL